MSGICVVFAKPPLPGRVKTRLAPQIGDQTAARVAEALLRDTWAIASTVADVRTVLSTTEPTADHGLGTVEIWDQGEGDLGARVERGLIRGILASGRAIAIGADSVAVPPDRYAQALAALDEGDDVAVLGPAEDGGFYLLGLRQAPTGLLAGLPWSAPDTLEKTRERLVERGFRVVELEPSWDVDRMPDLLRVRSDVPRAQAPHTHAVLDELGWDHEGPT